jgi:hypothetical protein
MIDMSWVRLGEDLREFGGHFGQLFLGDLLELLV